MRVCVCVCACVCVCVCVCVSGALTPDSGELVKFDLGKFPTAFFPKDKGPLSLFLINSVM